MKELNYNEVVDVGSGDGRIGYCGKFLGLDSHAIEIDDMLVDLEKSICQSSQIDFNPICADAINFDYTNFIKNINYNLIKLYKVRNYIIIVINKN